MKRDLSSTLTKAKLHDMIETLKIIGMIQPDIEIYIFHTSFYHDILLTYLDNAPEISFYRRANVDLE